MKKKLIIIGAVVVALLLALGSWAFVKHQRDNAPISSNDASDFLTEDSAREFVTQFYNDYLAVAINDGQAKRDVAEQYATDAVFEKMATYPATVDPLVCSDKKPDSYTIESTSVNDDGDVNVVTALKFGANTTKINLLVTEADGLVLDSFQCPN